jgi:hypothetical protein
MVSHIAPPGACELLTRGIQFSVSRASVCLLNMPCFMGRFIRPDLEKQVFLYGKMLQHGITSLSYDFILSVMVCFISQRTPFFLSMSTKAHGHGN